MRWDTYRLIADATARERRDPRIAFQFPPPGTWTSEFIDKRYDIKAALEDGTNLWIATEREYVKSGRASLFVETRNLLEALWHSTFDISLEYLKSPFENSPGAFSVNVPTGTIIDGVRIRPALVHIESDCYKTEDSALIEHHKIGMCSPRFAVILRVTAGGAIHTAAATDNDLARIFDGTANRLDTGYELTDTESHALSVHAKLYSGLLVYALSDPSHMYDGPPRMATERERRVYEKDERLLTSIGLPERLRGAPGVHFRGWHFRTLRAERFRRNEDGSPRVIFVSPTLVGSNKVKTAK